MKLATTKQIGPWTLTIDEVRDKNGKMYFCIRGQHKDYKSPTYFGSFSNRRAAQIKLQSFDPAEAQWSREIPALRPERDGSYHKHFQDNDHWYQRDNYTKEDK